MNPFSRLFKKAPPPPPPPTITERIASLHAAPVDALTAIALGTDELGLRVAAARLLPDGAALRALGGFTDAQRALGSRTPPEVRLAAHERLARLIDDGSIDFPGFCKELAQYPDTMTVIGLCKDADRLLQVLARIDNPSMLARIVVEGATSRVRQAAAASIEDPVQLQALLPLVRGKDKSVYKIIKQKCDALTAARRQADAAAREAASICESLEKHSTRTFDVLYAASLEILTARWHALPLRPGADVEQRGQLALARCAEVVAAHQRAVTQQMAEQATADAARAAREQARYAAQQTAAEQAETMARATADATAAHEAAQRAQAEQQAAATQAHYEIGSLIRLATSALRSGNSRKAARFRHAIDTALQTTASVPPYLTRTLQQLDASLNELKQWKDYVAAPKRIELIEEMEALVGSHDDPAELAEHIRSLQQEWRTINKGILSDDASGDVERFQAAFQAAFKPCQEYFTAQNALRRENLEARKRVLDRLQAFTATQATATPDYGLVAQVLREAPQEWRSHAPIDRDANRPFEIEFHRSMDDLRKILNAWYERNVTDKNALITRARHLATTEDTTQAIEGVKHLQVLWKETGPVSREQSQPLWDEFRRACDEVFQRREQAYAQYSAGLEEVKSQAIALCEQVEHALGASPTERLAARDKMPGWYAAFDALGEMPRADARNLRNRFERAIADFEAALAQQDLRDNEAAGANMFAAASHVRAYERAVLMGAPAEEQEALKSVAENFLAGVPRWSKGGLQALQQALPRAGTLATEDVAARGRALRLLCIRAEIYSSTPTPPEDESLRADYQMRLLMESMGQANHADDRDWDLMVLEWIGIGAVAFDLHQALEQRFRGCLARRPTMAPATTFRNYDRDNVRPDRDARERTGRRDERGRPESQGRRNR